MDLTYSMKKQLKAMAHHLKPVAMVGKLGLTDSLIAAVDKDLTDHELIKIKFNDFKEEKDDITEKIVSATNSTHVSTIGNVAIVYRESSEPEKRNISRGLL